MQGPSSQQLDQEEDLPFFNLASHDEVVLFDKTPQGPGTPPFWGTWYLCIEHLNFKVSSSFIIEAELIVPSSPLHRLVVKSKKIKKDAKNAEAPFFEMLAQVEDVSNVSIHLNFSEMGTLQISAADLMEKQQKQFQKRQKGRFSDLFSLPNSAGHVRISWCVEGNVRILELIPTFQVLPALRVVTERNHYGAGETVSIWTNAFLFVSFL